MTRSCNELFTGTTATILGNAADVVSGIAYDSKTVRPGDAFFCIVGHEHDGHSFAQEALEAGAKLLVVQRVPHLVDASEVTEVVVPDTRAAMAYASARFYGDPSAAFEVVGITGANGRTTVARLVDHIVSFAGKRAGVVSKARVRSAGTECVADALRESPDLQKALSKLHEDRCDVVALALDGEAIFLEKTWGISFAVTAFTDRAQDGSAKRSAFETAFEAKAKLFSKDYPARRVICIDSRWGRELLRRCSAADDNIVTTGFDATAQVHFVEMGSGASAGASAGAGANASTGIDLGAGAGANAAASTNASADIDPSAGAGASAGADRDTSAGAFVVLNLRGQDFTFAYELDDERDAQDLMCACGIALQLGFAPALIAASFESAPPIAELRAQWAPEPEKEVSVGDLCA